MSIIASAAHAGLTKNNKKIDSAADYVGTMVHRWRTANQVFANNAVLTNFPAAVGGVNLENTFGTNRPTFETNQLNGFGSVTHTSISFLRAAAIISSYASLSLIFVMKPASTADRYFFVGGDNTHAIIQGFGSTDIRYFNDPKTESLGALNTADFQVFGVTDVASVDTNRWHVGCSVTGTNGFAGRWVDILAFSPALTAPQMAANIAQSKLQYNLP